MSRETLEWLNHNTLIGFTAKRGNAWHYREGLQGDEPTHYAGPVPVADARRRLFGWDAIASGVWVDSPVTGGLVLAPGRRAFVRSDNGHLLGIFTNGYEPHPYQEWLVSTVSRLLDADEVFLSSSIREVMPVASVDGKAFELGPAAHDLQRELRGRAAA